MKTTEVFVEQVLTGLLLILIFTLPFGLLSGELFGNAFEWTDMRILNGLIAVGIAYLIGVPADRIADTLLSGLEKRHRGRVAAKEKLTYEDPFPEGLLKIAVLAAGGATAEWSDYLRSRIRLARALAVYSPALTFSALAAVAGFPPLGSVMVVVATVCLYVATFVEVIPQAKDLPKTQAVRGIDRDELKRKLDWRRDAATRALGIFVVASVALAALISSPAAFGVAASGILATIASAWSWTRINVTYRNFLVDFFGQGQNPIGARPRLANR